jgi:hypothetical protein
MWQRDNVIKFCEWKLMGLENGLVVIPEPALLSEYARVFQEASSAEID